MTSADRSAIVNPHMNVSREQLMDERGPLRPTDALLLRDAGAASIALARRLANGQRLGVDAMPCKWIRCRANLRNFLKRFR